MIQIVEGTRIATMGFPWYVVAVDHAEHDTLVSEAFVFLIDDYNRISHESRRRYVFTPNNDQEIPDDLNIENTLFDSAQQFATSTVAAWQWDAYKRSKARLVLTPPSYQQVGVLLLYRLWMGRFADKRITKMHDRTECPELKSLLREVIKLPKLGKN